MNDQDYQLETLAVRAGIARSQFNEHSEALYLTSSFVFGSAAEAAARYNNANRVKDEAELIDFFKAQGLKIVTPDVGAFRKAVQQKYLTSDMAKTWPKGLLERINAVR